MTMTALTKFVKILPPGPGFYTLWWSQHGHILKMCHFSLIPYILEENYFSTFNAKKRQIKCMFDVSSKPPIIIKKFMTPESGIFTFGKDHNCNCNFF